MTKLEQKLNKIAKEKKELEKKIAIEKKKNQDKFLKLLGKAYIKRLDDAKDSEGKLHDAKWRKDTLSTISKFLPKNEKIWFNEKIEDGLFNL